MVEQKIWNDCKAELKKKLNPHNYDSWVKPINYVSYKNTTLTLAVPSTFFVEWIEEHYKDSIKQVFNTYSGVDIDLVLRVDENQRKGPEKAAGLAEKPPIKKPVAAQPRNKSGLNEKYIFKHFVVGKSNEFCYASSLASANKIGEVYNPLFLYGGVGLGKTHLLQAIGNHVLQSNPGAVVLYLTSEKFVNMLINALQHGTMANFRRKFRNLDVLLVDDIQFIGGKERTQEEFFHTFNTLYELKKQIVIASDKFPKE